MILDLLRTHSYLAVFRDYWTSLHFIQPTCLSTVCSKQSFVNSEPSRGHDRAGDHLAMGSHKPRPIALQRVHVPTHEYSVVITTVLT